MRAILAALLVLGAGTAGAAPCYVFWATQCIEVRDALRRDITQHVLLSADKPFMFEGDEGQCPAALDRLLGNEGHQAVLDRFNRVLGKLRGCHTLDRLEPRVFDDGAEAYRQYRDLDQDSPIRKIHRIKRLPLR